MARAPRFRNGLHRTLLVRSPGVDWFPYGGAKLIRLNRPFLGRYHPLRTDWSDLLASRSSARRRHICFFHSGKRTSPLLGIYLEAPAEQYAFGAILQIPPPVADLNGWLELQELPQLTPNTQIWF